MKTLISLAAVAVATISFPTMAAAQAVPAATVAVVDLDRVTRECNACKTALTALQGQISSLRARQTALATPLEAEQKAIQAAITAPGMAWAETPTGVRTIAAKAAVIAILRIRIVFLR